jgi:sulfonate transport system substrate-binding protein
MKRFSRRGVLGASAAILTAGALPARAETKVVRIGYQPYGNLLLLKASGLLEATLKPLGWTVEWKRFVSGPPLMEALAVGAIDYGTAGETPPIFAQVGGAQIVYRGAEPGAPRGEAILVLDKSPIKTLADLKGKKVCFNKGSNVHYLYVKAIERAGLKPQDVTPIYLSPPDGRAAFERGSVDAWIIWDPFLAAAQASGHARILADGTGLVDNHQFYLSNRHFTDAKVLNAIQGAIREIDHRTIGDPAQSAEILSPEIGLPKPVVAAAIARQSWNIQPIDDKLIQAQQVIADTFFNLGLIGKTVRIADALPTS